MESDKADLIKMHYDLTLIDISDEESVSIKEKLKNLDALFIAGGNCFYLLQQIKRKGILQDIINFAEEKIYIGSSAGVCIVSPNIYYAKFLDNIEDAPLLNNYDALNLIDAYILPHYNCNEKYTILINEIIKNNNELNYVTLENNEALIVESKTKYYKKVTD